MSAAPFIDPDRVALIRRKSRRDVTISATSTVFIIVLTVALVYFFVPGWKNVQETFFNPADFKASFPSVLRGLWLNIQLFIVAEIFILLLSLAVALIRLSKAPFLVPFRLLATMYVDIFRGTPTLLVVYLFAFGMPSLKIEWLPTSATFWALLALILSYGAYVSEVFRAGISSVHPAQQAAARTLGLSTWQTTRYVVLPQAVRRVVPPLLNDFASLQKDTALVSVVGPTEALRAAENYANYYFNYTSLVVAALLFIALSLPVARFTDRLMEKQRKKTSAGGAL
jgi:polar amino acid transport system permease protein